MIRTLSLTTILVAAAAATAGVRAEAASRDYDANGSLDALIARHAAANNLPEDLVRRVIKRESGGRAHVVSARQLRPDADQAARPPGPWAIPAAPPACSMPTPT